MSLRNVPALQDPLETRVQKFNWKVLRKVKSAVISNCTPFSTPHERNEMFPFFCSMANVTTKLNSKPHTKTNHNRQLPVHNTANVSKFQCALENTSHCRSRFLRWLVAPTQWMNAASQRSQPWREITWREWTISWQNTRFYLRRNQVSSQKTNTPHKMSSAPSEPKPHCALL